MNVILASHLGMCFGVRRAIAAAHAVPVPDQTTIHGELVHNPEIVAALAARGFVQSAEYNHADLPSTPQVLITAHGISQRERGRFLAAGKALIDTTCPLVRRIHEATQRLQREGFFIIVIGKPQHVEIRGIIGDLRDCAVVETADEARTFPAARLAIVCQSTVPPDHADRVCRAIAAQNPNKEIRFLDTICAPTRARQAAARALLDQIQALVVVGGRHSHNTRQLVDLARRHGVPAFQVETPADLDRDRLAEFSVVGLTAGTSTPDATIRAVHLALLTVDGAVAPQNLFVASTAPLTRSRIRGTGLSLRGRGASPSPLPAEGEAGPVSCRGRVRGTSIPQKSPKP